MGQNLAPKSKWYVLNKACKWVPNDKFDFHVCVDSRQFVTHTNFTLGTFSDTCCRWVDFEPWGCGFSYGYHLILFSWESNMRSGSAPNLSSAQDWIAGWAMLGIYQSQLKRTKVLFVNACSLKNGTVIACFVRYLQ